MNAQTSPTPTFIPAGSSGLGVAVLMTLVAITGILLIFYQTTWSMISTWNRSDTYAHGFLILPFSIYMIWSSRKSLILHHHQPNPWALLLLGVLGFIWLVAALASVQIVTQYILVAMIPAAVYAILGGRMLMAMAFPLAYLFFAVPFGDVLIPPLIDHTADFTVAALQLSGIPVYREGTYFSLPTGNWSVVEACSGLRYLIASVTLGTLYAYLTYQSLTRRLAFIAVSIIVPIVANWIRAYLIVVTGHLSGMTLAVGVDHLIYGWIFFGFVMLLMFWIGSFWREDEDIEVTKKNDKQVIRSENSGVSIKNTILTAVSVLIMAFIWPVFAAYLDNDIESNLQDEINLTIISEKWVNNSDPIANWEPTYVGSPRKFYQNYQHDDHKVSLYVAYYHNQQQGNELINSGNVLVPEMDSPWRIINVTNRTVIFDSREAIVRQTLLQSSSKKLVIWRWYWLGDEEVINPYLAKVILAKNKLLSISDGGAEVIIASPYINEPDEAVPALQQFLDGMRLSILEELRNARSS